MSFKRNKEETHLSNDFFQNLTKQNVDESRKEYIYGQQGAESLLRPLQGKVKKYNAKLNS